MANVLTPKSDDSKKTAARVEDFRDSKMSFKPNRLSRFRCNPGATGVDRIEFIEKIEPKSAIL